MKIFQAKVRLDKQKFLSIMLRSFLFFALCASFLLFIFISKRNVVEQLREGDIALKSIFAPVDFFYQGPIDEEKTLIARNQAGAAIPQTYKYSAVSLPQNLSETVPEETREHLETFKQIFNEFFGSYYVLLASEKDRLLQEKQERVRVINDQNSSFVSVADIKTLDELKNSFYQAVEARLGKKPKSILIEASDSVLGANLALDVERMNQDRAKAVETVAPVFTQIEVKKNELLINKGQKITKAHLAKLSALLTLRSEKELVSFYLGIAMLIVILVIVSSFFLKVYYPRIYLSSKKLGLLSVLFILCMSIGKALELSPLSVNSFVIPVAAFPMAYFMLTASASVALMFGIFLSTVMTLSLGNNLGLLLAFYVGTVAGISALVAARRRNHILQAGIIVGLVQFVTILAWGLFNSLQYEVALNQAFWGIASGIFCATLLMVLIPVLETIFSFVTNVTLLELSDFNQPLLKEMVLKAPGTYHHSLLVGNLSEAAAEAIGANSLLARVGSYFHDIGKIDKAEYFSENQGQSFSKHDSLNPSMSKLVIVNHVKEGIELGRRHKLRKPIIDFIEQHHGTSLVYYFYRRALEDMKDERQIKEEVFRYSGPKPQTKETAICLLADCVEAATRSIDEPSPAKIEDAVHTVINNKFIDGQLDECDLTLKDLERIARIFSRILMGIYHSRVVYPQEKNGNQYDQHKESAKQAFVKRTSKDSRKKDSR